MKLWISVVQNIFDMKSSHLNMNIWWKLHLVKSKVSMSRTISKFFWRVADSVQGIYTALSSYCHNYWKMHRNFTVNPGDWWQQLMRHFKKRTVEYTNNPPGFFHIKLNALPSIAIPRFGFYLTKQSKVLFELGKYFCRSYDYFYEKLSSITYWYKDQTTYSILRLKPIA